MAGVLCWPYMGACMMRWILAGAMLAGAAVAAPNVFDKPVSTKIVPLPPDPANPQAKPKRSCFYYPGFLVKEVDLGEKGADELSIADGASPCTAKIVGEKVVKDWSGYFLGVKSRFVFFNSDDGYDGGLPFAVFDATSGKKLFEDSREGDAFRSVAVNKGELTMRYRRVFLAPCSLFADAKGCWKKIAAATGLSEPPPNCNKAYKDEMTRTPKFAAAVAKAKSVVAYNAEARYAAGKLSIAPLPGAATCWIED